MTRENTVFILGASDPEMQHIENILNIAHLKHVRALYKQHLPVTALTAYAFQTVSEDISDYEHVVLVECLNYQPLEFHYNTVHIIDHHRQGNPGYGKPPGEFLLGSSLGQVLKFIVEHNIYGKFLTHLHHHHVTNATVDFTTDIFAFSTDKHKWYIKPDNEIIGWEIPKYWVLAAAADHCLAHAYMGFCPGVSIEDLKRFRIETKSNHQHIPEQEVVKNIERAKEQLLAAPLVVVDKNTYGEHEGFHLANLVDKSIKELPEASMQLHIPYLSGFNMQNGRSKICIGGDADGTATKAFLNGWAASMGLSDLYGDPARGYAGGFKTIAKL